jgi:hypothetical protein
MTYMTKAAAPAAEPGPAAAKAVPAEAAGKEAPKEQAPDRPATRTIRGFVRDARGQPVAAAQVNLDPSMEALVPPVPNAQPGSSEIAATDREGTFELPGMPRVDLKIWIKRPGFLSQSATVPAKGDDVDVEYPLVLEPSARQRPVVRRDDTVPPGLRSRLRFIDLSRLGNELLADGPGNGGNDLNRLPRGIRDLDGHFFQVDDELIHLAGQMTAGLPREAKGIEINARGRRLLFLHAVQQAVPAGTEVAVYVVHYADGSSERIPIVYGSDLVNWWFFKRGVDEAPTGARIAWTGENDASELNQSFVIRLYSQTWTNPHPDREIKSLDVMSTGTLCDPFLVALTVEQGQ